jgi:hypothetical protein
MDINYNILTHKMGHAWLTLHTKTHPKISGCWGTVHTFGILRI